MPDRTSGPPLAKTLKVEAVYRTLTIHATISTSFHSLSIYFYARYNLPSPVKDVATFEPILPSQASPLLARVQLNKQLLFPCMQLTHSDDRTGSSKTMSARNSEQDKCRNEWAPVLHLFHRRDAALRARAYVQQTRSALPPRAAQPCRGIHDREPNPGRRTCVQLQISSGRRSFVSGASVTAVIEPTASHVARYNTYSCVKNPQSQLHPR
jgi:hypothetical protein